MDQIEVLAQGTGAAPEHHHVAASGAASALLRQGAVGGHQGFQRLAAVEGGGQGDQPPGHVGADRPFHKLTALVFGVVIAAKLAECPGQLGIHRCRAQGQATAHRRGAGRLQHRFIE